MNQLLNSFYLFVSRRRWIRRLHLFKLPDIGFCKTEAGFKYAVSLNDWKGPTYHLIQWGEETYEPENKKALLSFLPENNGVFMDIGANIGLFTFYFKTRKPSLEAYLFEPEPVSNACLDNTIRWNNLDKINVQSIALSDKASSATFFIDGKNSGGHSLIEENILSEGDTISNRITVKTNTLDLFVKEQNLTAIHGIKIDVQGHEYEVLSGALETLKKYKPVLLIECYFKELRSDKSILSLFEKINSECTFFIYEPKTKKSYTIRELYDYADKRNSENNLSFSDFLFIPENEENKNKVLTL